MQTVISSKGQVVLPATIRRKLGLKAGDELEASVRSGKILLVPRHARPGKPKMFVDPVTGLPVLTAGQGAPTLTSEQVGEILSSFP